MSVFASIIDTGDLISSVVAALVSAVIFTLAVSISIRGAARWVDLGNDGRGVAAAFNLLISILAGAVALGLVCTGLYLLIST